MGNKFLRLFLIVISSFAASVGIASCSVMIDGNTHTTSDSTTSNNPTTDTTSDSSTGAHSHSYNQQVVTDEYKAADADCEHGATYYYSCSCGDKSSETFEYGESLGHNWDYEYLQTSEGEYYQNGTCSRCGEKEQITIQSVNNLNFEVINEEEKNCEVIGYKKYYNDERDNYICIPKMWNDYKVTSIGNYAFKDCTSLNSVTIGNDVTSIGHYAFYGCAYLNSIVIPDSVTSIGYAVFYGCDSLTSIIVKEGNTVYDSRENCNAIIETSTNTIIASCATTIIPDSLSSIGDYAFSYRNSLSSIVIPDSVTLICGYAFYGCSSLSSIVIPNSVTSIGNYSFGRCTSLTDVYYNGSKEQWNAIYIGSDNDELKSATIHYNYMG